MQKRVEIIKSLYCYIEVMEYKDQKLSKSPISEFFY